MISLSLSLSHSLSLSFSLSLSHHQVIALHQEGGGRSYLHRMRLAHARVFPNSNKPVPKATNASHSGVYRTISSPVDRITTSPPPALGQEVNRLKWNFRIHCC